MTKKQYYILTFGCQMNKNDSERIAGLLSGLGLDETKEPQEAEVLLINTCSVRQQAEDRVFGFVREWQKFRENKPNLFIGVTGCMPGRDKDGKIQKKLPGVDWFFSIDNLPQLPKRLREFNPDLFKIDFSDLENYWQFTPKRAENFRAFVSIQTGCDNFCTYCVVPYARGREQNRSLKDILAEIKDLAEHGCKEVTLLGQVVNNYKLQNVEYGILSEDNIFAPTTPPLRGTPPPAGGDNFAALLWEINQIEGIERVNWTAADPQYFNDYQIQALTLPKQINYLHLPVQSGDNEILKKMNRKYTRDQYLELIKKIKKARSDIALGTDIIVGFCGETEEQFQNTVDLYHECDFDISYHAMYSERSGTLASKNFIDDLSKEEKKRRWQILQDLMEVRVFEKNQKYLDQVLLVLVDRCEDGYCYGNSSEMKLVCFPGEEKLIGQVVEVKIKKPEMWILYGEYQKQ